MKPLADIVVDLPGLCPAADSLAALTRPVAACWDAVVDDPAAHVLLLQHLPNPDAVVDPTIALREDSLLAQALEIVSRNDLPFIDGTIPGVDAIRLIAARQAKLAAELAPRLQVDPRAAAACGMLAPLGWFAIAAADPTRILGDLDRCLRDGSAWQTQAWGTDHTSLTRRLCRAWRLPTWVAAVLGNLSLHVDQSRRLGADPNLVRTVQLAVLGVQRHGGLGLSISTPLPELLTAAGLDDDAFDHMVADAVEHRPARLESPKKQPLLADLLRLAVENRARADRNWIDRLHRDLDRLYATLDAQQGEEQARLKQQKLSALSEFAAGAGHEINNPLAVISGQAQYLIKQIDIADELLVEEPSPTLYLDHLRSKFTKSLSTIVGQTQRIHQVLMDLMHFARPQTPRPTLVPVAKLMADVAAGLRVMAEDRKVGIACPETAPNLGIRVDPAQIRLALNNLLRNAIEAAPSGGWASLRVERETDGTLSFVVEDNGPGPQGAVREHLFDPFYSGRSAGRGRGLGLSAAWRLARQHGGDVRFDATAVGVTRFVLSLPADLIETSAPANGVNGRHSTDALTRA
jgi:two-component system, NtrC family, sensor kinase